MVEEHVPPSNEEKIYVALGKNVAKNKSTLIWAIENIQSNKICIIHIHQPLQMIPLLGRRLQPSGAEEQIMTAKILEEYVRICHEKGVQVEKLCVEMDSIGSAIVQLISHHNVKNLVIGAAADKHYSKRMTGLRSKKAIFVCQLAPETCHIWFTCKGHLICTREATRHDPKTLSTLLSEFQSLASMVKTTNPVQDVMNGQSKRVLDANKEKREARNSSSSWFNGLSNVNEKYDHPSSTCTPDEQIQQALAEARVSKQDALAEALRRQEAENEAFEARKMADEYKDAYFEELNRREETELVLANEKEEHLKITSLFIDQIARYESKMKELQQQSDSALELLQRVTLERDMALTEAETQRKTLVDSSESPWIIPQTAPPPPYFMCPIFHDVMQDPHVAADGFTYEKEAIRTWLNIGHNTSPMTNEKLTNTYLIPNRPLRSAIQEWLQRT